MCARVHPPLSIGLAQIRMLMEMLHSAATTTLSVVTSTRDGTPASSNVVVMAAAAAAAGAVAVGIVLVVRRYRERRDAARGLEDGPVAAARLRRRYHYLCSQLQGEPLPRMVVDLAAFRRNGDAFAAIAAAADKRLRLATKSLRVPQLILEFCERYRSQLAGLMCYSWREVRRRYRLSAKGMLMCGWCAHPCRSSSL